MIERFRAMHDFPSCDITAEVRKTPNKRIVLGLTAYYRIGVRYNGMRNGVFSAGDCKMGEKMI